MTVAAARAVAPAAGVPARASLLVVDDEPHVVDGLRRHLGRRFAVVGASSGRAGLELLDSEGPFEVVLSDFRMPGMDGAEFLAAARAKAPGTVRLLLTGQADVEGAARVVNDAQVFRFLLKPVPHDTLVAALDAAVRQHRLEAAERELLEHTLRGAVEALTETLALANPAAFSRALRLRHLVAGVVEAAGLADGWHIEIAAMLSQLGALTLPPAAVERVNRGEPPLGEAEREMVERLPEVALGILAGIPRFEPVTDAIRDAARAPAGPSPEAGAGCVGGRVLRLVTEYDLLAGGGTPPATVLAELESRPDHEPELVLALAAALRRTDGGQVRWVDRADLVPGMVLAADLVTVDDVKLIAAGHPVTATLLRHLRNYDAQGRGVREPIAVHPPVRGPRSPAPAGVRPAQP